MVPDLQLSQPSTAYIGPLTASVPERTSYVVLLTGCNSMRSLVIALLT